MGLSAAQLANQARLRARAAVSKYYDGALVSDDELHPLTTRNVCLRTQVSPSLALSNRLHPHPPARAHNVCLETLMIDLHSCPLAEQSAGLSC